MLVFTVSIVTNNSLEIDYSQGHYIQISSIMHGTRFLPFTGKVQYEALSNRSLNYGGVVGLQNH